jgi:hypothetical protein
MRIDHLAMFYYALFAGVKPRKGIITGILFIDASEEHYHE